MSGILNVLFICDEWKSGKGGLSTVNRIIASHFGKWSKDRMKVFCYVLNCDDRDRKHAEKDEVTLITAEENCLDDTEWLNFPPQEIPHLHVVIGHGRQFGRAAYYIKRNYTNCKWVQFVHVYCEDLGKQKLTEAAKQDPIEENEQKHDKEIKLCKAADLVVAVGPRLQSKYQKCLPDITVEVITPWILEDFFRDVTLRPSGRVEAEKFYVFVFGRGTKEDLKLKGYDIIANAIASLGEKFEFTFVGSPEGQHTAIKRWFQEQSKITDEQLVVRGYCTQEKLKDMLKQADLVALPSRVEGFGMTALEALSGAVPILVSNQSGIAKALERVKSGRSVIVEGGESEWAKKIEELSNQTREERLMYVRQLRENYSNMYSRSKQLQLFETKIRDLVEESSANASSSSSVTHREEKEPKPAESI